MPEDRTGINMENRRQKIKESSLDKKGTKEEDEIEILPRSQWQADCCYLQSLTQ